MFIQMFITFFDHLKLNVRAVDELFPTLNDLYSSINTMSRLPEDCDVTDRVKKWSVSFHLSNS